MKEWISLGWRNLKRNKRRSIATGLAIGLSCAGLLLIGGYVIRVENYLRNVAIFLSGTGHLAIYKKDGFEKHFIKPNHFSLSADDQRIIHEMTTKDKNVWLATKYLMASGLIGNGCLSVPFLGIGVIPEDEKKMRSHPAVQEIARDFYKILKGKPLWEYKDLQEGISIGINLSKNLHKIRVHEEKAKTEGSVPFNCNNEASLIALANDPNVQLAGGTFDGSFSALDAEIVNFVFTGLEDREGDFLTARLQHFQRLYDTDKVTFVSLFLNDPSNIERQATEWENRLSAAGLDISVYPWSTRQMSPLYVGTMTFIKTITTVIAAIFLLVVFLAIVNSTTITIIERTREVGTLRSLGYTPGFVSFLFTIEYSLLCGVASVFGLVFSLTAARAINLLKIPYQSPGLTGTMYFGLTITWPLVGVVFFLVFCVIGLTTFFVVRKRAKRNIVSLLTN